MAKDNYEISFTWKPFFLRPNMPLDGHPKDPDVKNRVGARLKQAGLSAGIDFTGLTDRYPNSTLAHVALDYVKELENKKVLGPGSQNEYQELLFKGYFTDGIYPDAESLVGLGSKINGLDLDDLKRELESSKRQEKVKGEAYAASRGGIRGVPFFIVNDVPLFSGAQPVHSFLEAFEEVADQ